MPNTKPTLYSTIKPRSMVTIVTQHGQMLKGRAVMLGPAGWVLNLGGRHGTPCIASVDNVVGVNAQYQPYPLQYHPLPATTSFNASVDDGAGVRGG